MSQTLKLKWEVPDDLARLQLPSGVKQRLQQLLDIQDAGQTLSDAERMEAEGLVELAEFFALLRLQVERESQTLHLNRS